MDIKIIWKIHLQQMQGYIFHQVFSMSTICSLRSVENKHNVYRGKDCMKNFCKFLRKHAMKIISFKKRKIKLLTKEQQES